MENSEWALEELNIDEEATDISHTRINRIPYPAVSFNATWIYFNKYCNGFFKSNRVHVSKTTNFLIFTDGVLDTDYRLSAGRGVGQAISAPMIRKLTGIPVGTYYRLYKAKTGGYAIKRYEPLNMKEEAI